MEKIKKGDKVERISHGKDIIFESKSPKNPDNKRIIMTSGDGKIKKHLSKSVI